MADNNSVVQFLAGAIPRYVSNSIVVRFMDVLRRLNYTGKKHLEANTKSNINNLKGHYNGRKYVEDQNAYADIKLGKTTMAYAGCEVFAVYNALLALKARHISLAELIGDFEKDGIMLSGHFGVAVTAIRDFFIAKGFNVRTAYKKEDCDELIKASKVIVISVYNNCNDIRAQIHTMCITMDGGYYAHNVYCDGSCLGPFDSFGELFLNINYGRAKLLYAVGVSD